MSSSEDDEASVARVPARGRCDGISSSAAMTLTVTSSLFGTSASNVINANVAVVGGGANKQKSLFGGMGRVRNINHLREKWSGKPKVIALPAAPMSPTSSPSSAMPVALRKSKKPHAPSSAAASSESESDRDSDGSRRNRVLSAIDMARYRTLSSWLEHNGIELPASPSPPLPLPSSPPSPQQQQQQQKQQQRPHSLLRRSSQPLPSSVIQSTDKSRESLRVDPFDDVYDSLERLERTVESEISQLRTASCAHDDTLVCRVPPPLHASTTQQVTANNSTVSSTNAPTAAPSLVDYLVVIGPDLADVALQSYWQSETNTMFEATVAFAWPPEAQFNAESIEHFCFPSGVAATRVSTALSPLSSSSDSSNYRTATATGDDFFVLVLAGGGAQGQSVQYAACMKRDLTLPGTHSSSAYEPQGGRSPSHAARTTVSVCYCLISVRPFLPFFRALLTQLLDDHSKDLELETDLSAMGSVLTNRHAHRIDDTLQRLQHVKLPATGSAVSVQLFSQLDEPLQLTRPRAEPGADETNTLLLQWALPLVLSHLSIDQVLRIVGFLLLEMKVVVVSKRLPLVSAATVSIASLLQPLKWAGPLITVLPPFLHEYLEAPVPLICGVDALSCTFECSRGTVIVDLERNDVMLHADDALSLNGRSLPGFAALAQSLDVLTRQLLLRPRGSHAGNAATQARTSSTPARQQQQMTSARSHLIVDAVIRRVRHHVEQFIATCRATHNASGSDDDLVQLFTQSQMFQKYQDDQQHNVVALDTTAMNATTVVESFYAPAHRALPAVAPEKPLYDWHEAASILFRFAVTGVTALSSDTKNDHVDRRGQESVMANGSDAEEACINTNKEADATPEFEEEVETTATERTECKNNCVGIRVSMRTMRVRRTHSNQAGTLDATLGRTRSSLSRSCTERTLDVSPQTINLSESLPRSKVSQHECSIAESSALSDLTVDVNNAASAQELLDAAQHCSPTTAPVQTSGSRVSSFASSSYPSPDPRSSINSNNNNNSNDNHHNNSNNTGHDGAPFELIRLPIESRCVDSVALAATESTTTVMATMSTMTMLEALEILALEELALEELAASSAAVDASQLSTSSDASSADAIDTDSNSADSPPHCRDAPAVVAAGRNAEQEKVTHEEQQRLHRMRTLSCCKIQKSWRQRREQTQTASRTLSPPLLYDTSDSLRGAWASALLLSSNDLSKTATRAVVAMQKCTKSGEWTDCCAWLAPDLASLSWESYVNGRRSLLSTLALADVTLAAFESAGLQQQNQLHESSRTRTFATLELVCENKRRYFRYERTSESMCFAATLFRALHAVAVMRDDALLATQLTLPLTSNQQQQKLFDDQATESSLSMRLRRLSSAARATTLCTTTSDVDKFKLWLQDGILVEKHGRVGKPHLRLLFTDVLCSRLMWKKPPRASAYDRMSALARRRRSSSSSSSSSSSTFGHKSLLVAAITAVLEGKQTRVFQRDTARTSDAAHCLSVVTAMRTLDVRALSVNDYDALTRGLRTLIADARGSSASWHRAGASDDAAAGDTSVGATNPHD